MIIGCAESNSTTESNLAHGEKRMPREPIRAWGKGRLVGLESEHGIQSMNSSVYFEVAVENGDRGNKKTSAR